MPILARGKIDSKIFIVKLALARLKRLVIPHLPECYYALNVAMANVINDNLDNVNITIMETGGTADNFEYMRDGQAHFGQTTDSDTYLLLNDMGT